MIRVLFFLVIVLVLALGASWMADHPGTVLVSFGGQEYQASTLVALVAVLVAAAVLLVAWTLLRFLLRIPSLMTVASHARRRQRGYEALSRGMVAVGSGDAETARRQSTEASRLLRGEPLALLLQAQSAQLAGDREQAETTFKAMLQHPDTRTLALRGLHMEALRRGDTGAALAHAEEAQKIATLPWAAQAVLQARAAEGDWAGALKAVERNAGGRITDRATANRQRAVLETAMALDLAERAPEEAIELLRDALKRAPTLVPAAATAGRLLGRKGDVKRATRVIEAAFAATPHPDLADAYLRLRHGDSAYDRLARAETLARQAPGHLETRLMLARAALDTRDFARARAELAPALDDSRPSRRLCLTMADIEEAENGETGALFEWLHRASRGARDPAWIADGLVSDRWSPVSPVSGRLDAFTWAVPPEQLAAADTMPVSHERSDEHSRRAVTASDPTPALIAAEAETAPS